VLQRFTEQIAIIAVGFRMVPVPLQTFDTSLLNKARSTTAKDRFMRSARIGILCASFGLALAAASSPARANSPYDGLWKVTIVTNTGSCEPSASSTITVSGGNITAPGAEISGRVGPSGNVRVSIRGTHANGQLNGNAGSGKWNGASGGIPCSGRWEASRQ
jgi:hypothetical protein